MNNLPTVAVLGLGAIGHAFAANLLKNHFSVRAWNRTRARADDLVGAIACDSPHEASRLADLVITVLPDGPTTEQVLLGDEGALAGLRQHGAVVQMGTIGLHATERLIAILREQRPDVAFIDAPISGTKGPAEQGQVRVLASGDRGGATAIEAVFTAISRDVRWLGEAGAGSRMKLVVNAWLIAMMQGLAEAARLADRLGFDMDDLWQAIEGGPLASPYAKAKLDMIRTNNFDAQMALSWGLKDARLALEAGAGIQMPSLERISEFWAATVDAGLGGEDISVVYRQLGVLPLYG